MASGFIFLPEFGSKSWKDPVATALALPSVGNDQGDARVALDTDIIYIWTGSTWVSAGGGSGVTSLNSLTGALDIVAGSGINVGTVGSNITVSNTGVTSLNSETGAVNIVAGPGIVVTPAGQNITIESTTPYAVSAIELSFIASVNIAAMQMVISVDGTHATLGNDNTTVQNARVLGIALTSATAGTTFNALLFGTVTDSSFAGLTINDPMYLDTTSFLTQTLPTTPRFMVVCGKYLGGNTVFINISLPVQL